VAKYSQFPDSEYVDRYEKFQDLIKDSQLDAVIVTAKENVLYFSGLQTVGWDTKTRPLALIMARGEAPVFVLPESLENVAEETTWVENLHLWGGRRIKDAAKNPVEGIVSVVKELGLDSARIGMEFGEEMYLAMHMTEFFDLQKQLPSATLTDAAPLIWEMRMIKTAREVECLRKACAATCKAFERAFETMHEGMTERQLAGVMFQEMARQTGYRPGFVVVRSGPLKYKMINVPPFDKPMEKGDMVLIDAGATYNDYWCDMMRMANIGGPTEEQLAFFDVEREAQEAAIQTIRAGIPIKEVVEAANEVFRRRGFADRVGTMERIGHGVGLDLHEPPNIAASNPQTLRSGMVITVEPIFYDKPHARIGNFGIENMLLVTDTGFEDLTPLSRDLVVIRR